MTTDTPQTICVATEKLRLTGPRTSTAVGWCDVFVVRKDDNRRIPLDVDRVRDNVRVGDQIRFEHGFMNAVDNGHSALDANAVLDATAVLDRRVEPWRRTDAMLIVDVLEIKADGNIVGTCRTEPVHTGPGPSRAW